VEVGRSQRRGERVYDPDVDSGSQWRKMLVEVGLSVWQEVSRGSRRRRWTGRGCVASVRRRSERVAKCFRWVVRSGCCQGEESLRKGDRWLLRLRAGRPRSSVERVETLLAV
jgi:hypothetical protein